MGNKNINFVAISNIPDCAANGSSQAFNRFIQEHLKGKSRNKFIKINLSRL